MRDRYDLSNAQAEDEEFEDGSDVEDQAAAKRLLAKINAQKEATRKDICARRVHSVAEGDDVHAAFTIAASDFRDVMKATRLSNSKSLREMMIVGSDLRVTTSIRDVRFSFNVPISDVYINGSQSTSNSFKIAARLDNGGRNNVLAVNDEQLYFVIKLQKRCAELRWHAPPPTTRRPGKQTPIAVGREIRLIDRHVLQFSLRQVQTPRELVHKVEEAVTLHPRHVARLLEQVSGVLKGVAKKELESPMMPLTVSGGEISASQSSAFALARSPFLDGLEFAFRQNDGRAIARLLTRCSGLMTLVKSDGRIYGRSGAAEISFTEVPHRLQVGDLVSRVGASLASATFEVGALLECVWSINHVLQPRAKPGERYLNIAFEGGKIKLHAESSRGGQLRSAHFSISIDDFCRNVEGEQSLLLRSVDGIALEAFLENIDIDRAKLTFFEEDVVAISSVKNIDESEVTGYFSGFDGEIALL